MFETPTLLTSFNYKLYVSLHVNQLTPSRAGVSTTVFSRQAVYLKLSFALCMPFWYFSFAS